MHLIGLTGGIASGKSTVAGRLAALGAVHIDADELARRVVDPGQEALTAIAERFGPEVLNPDGSLDRGALGQLIFEDAEARADLNAITHPAVRRLAASRIADAAAADPDAIVVYDIPLLVETMDADGALDFDLIVVVHADTETRMRRLIELRGLSREEAAHRLNSQATDTERLAIADVVIDANGTLEETLAQADRLWARLAHSPVSERGSRVE